MKLKYYYLSTKWTHVNDEEFTFWQPNSNGYTYFLEDAGIYDKDITNLSEGIICIPTNIIENFSIKVENLKTKIKKSVLPNRGFIRKEFGFTKFDMNNIKKSIGIIGDYTSYDIHNQYLERSKKVKTGYFNVKMKPNKILDEEWCYNEDFKAENRNSAISLALKEWSTYMFSKDIDYITFKSIISVKNVYCYVFDKWVEI